MEFKNNKTKPYLIGVCGGTASGKTSLCKYLLNTFRFLSIFSILNSNYIDHFTIRELL